MSYVLLEDMDVVCYDWKTSLSLRNALLFRIACL